MGQNSMASKPQAVTAAKKLKKEDGVDTCERQEGEEQQHHRMLAVRHGRFRECDLRECHRLRNRQEVHRIHKCRTLSVP